MSSAVEFEPSPQATPGGGRVREHTDAHRQAAVDQGWCPPVPLFRPFGVRTRQEIDAERFALKPLRGDLDEFCRPND
jgi:hypothetical protein